jgi:hypothetical protein
MSKWPMRGHFRYLRFKTFPMTLRTLQCKVFWAFLSNSKHSGVSEDSKSPTLGVLGFTPTLGQSGVATFCMSHIVYKQVNQVDFWLFLVASQIDNLSFDPSFGYNLCFRCPNEQCEPILDIYVWKAFQWYKERHKPLSYDPWNCSLKSRESTGMPSPKVGVALGVWRFTPSHFLTLSGVCDVTPGLSFGPHPCNPLALTASPKLKLWHES